MHNIGEQVRALRNSKKITQSELAERVGVTKATISAYENDTRLPSYDVLIKIAQLFHVSVDNLLGYSNKYIVDISALTQKQRVTIREIVAVYRSHNVMYRSMMESDSMVNELKAAGLVDPFEDWLTDDK